MSFIPEHISGYTTHARRGSIKHTFRYNVDYVLLDPSAPATLALFSRNRFNLAQVDDRDHGGPPREGRGLKWAQDTFQAAGLACNDMEILLLTQPKIMGYIFNPVSFWLAYEGTELRAVIAEVTNTFGDRHSYLCANTDFAPITAAHKICATKIFHVSPFQDVAGEYQFTFDITTQHISIRIAYKNGTQGVIATLIGDRSPLTNISLIKAVLYRPIGALRTITLIYWQALQLKFKGAAYRPRPKPPEQEVSS